MSPGLRVSITRASCCPINCNFLSGILLKLGSVNFKKSIGSFLGGEELHNIKLVNQLVFLLFNWLKFLITNTFFFFLPENYSDKSFPRVDPSFSYVYTDEFFYNDLKFLWRYAEKQNWWIYVHLGIAKLPSKGDVFSEIPHKQSRRIPTLT